MSNQSNDNQEQVFSEEQFRNVFFSKRPDPKRSRLQADAASAAAASKKKLRKNSLANRSVALPSVKSTATKTTTIPAKAPKFIRRFRSRSLPIISYNRQSALSTSMGPAAASVAVAASHPHHHHHHHPHHHIPSAAAAASAAGITVGPASSSSSSSSSSSGSMLPVGAVSASAAAVAAASVQGASGAAAVAAAAAASSGASAAAGGSSGGSGSLAGAGTASSSSSSKHHGHHHHHHHSSSTHLSGGALAAPPLLPPINLQSLKEIDLHEILKNPQLRHDILFDPQLQFRPNLDGERGKRKKNIIDNYWGEIEKECHAIFVMKNFNLKTSRIPSLFITLRDILLSLLPYKDRTSVNDIMDMDLLVQQLAIGTFDFVSLANWLGKIFKCHCAPMRDNWVTEMVAKFTQANAENSVEKLVCGLRMIFSILEAMKLDVANHQIRILRPVLIETAVEFEKDYFSQLISHHKLDINDSLKWYYKGYHKKLAVMRGLFPQQQQQQQPPTEDKAFLRNFLISAILDLLSCRKMVNEFPSTLAFDHTRLILLRADIRQLVCIQLCVVLYKQLIFNNAGKLTPQEKARALSPDTISRIQEEILSIVTDDNGTIKWTRNVNAISLQLVKNAYGAANMSQSMIDFSYSWLIKQIQPNSEVYGLMEEKVFKELLLEISGNLKGSAGGAFGAAAAASAAAPSSASASSSSASGAASAAAAAGKPDALPSIVSGKKFPLSSAKGAAAPAAGASTSEMANIATRIASLVKFHWNVFGSYYAEFLNSQH